MPITSSLICFEIKWGGSEGEEIVMYVEVMLQQQKKNVQKTLIIVVIVIKDRLERKFSSCFSHSSDVLTIMLQGMRTFE
jgi:hypothetical protein